MVLPWLQEAESRDRDQVARFVDGCEKCMETTSKSARQGLGCGYEPPVEGARPSFVLNVARDPKDERPLTTCPGYTTRLPQVVETSYARLHWKNSQLEAWARGPATEQQLDAITVLEASAHAVEAWRLKPASKGGGGPG